MTSGARELEPDDLAVGPRCPIPAVGQSRHDGQSSARLMVLVGVADHWCILTRIPNLDPNVVPNPHAKTDGARRMNDRIGSQLADQQRRSLDDSGIDVVASERRPRETPRRAHTFGHRRKHGLGSIYGGHRDLGLSGLVGLQT